MTHPVWHSLILITAIILSFALTQHLIQYGLLLVFLLLVLYWILKTAFTNAIPHHRLADSLIATVIITVAVNATGQVHSPLFFLNYILLFSLSLLLEPVIPVAAAVTLIIGYLFTLSPNEPLKNLLPLFALALITPFALFLGEEYQKLLEQKKDSIILKKQNKDLQEKIHPPNRRVNPPIRTINPSILLLFLYGVLLLYPSPALSAAFESGKYRIETTSLEGTMRPSMLNNRSFSQNGFLISSRFDKNPLTVSVSKSGIDLAKSWVVDISLTPSDSHGAVLLGYQPEPFISLDGKKTIGLTYKTSNQPFQRFSVNPRVITEISTRDKKQTHHFTLKTPPSDDLGHITYRTVVGILVMSDF